MQKALKLDAPIKGMDGKEYAQLVFRPVKARDYMGIDMRKFGLEAWAAEDCMRIISNITGVPVDVIGELPNDKFQEAIALMLDFFEAPSATPIAEGSTSNSGASSSSSSPEASASATTG